MPRNITRGTRFREHRPLKVSVNGETTCSVPDDAVAAEWSPATQQHVRRAIERHLEAAGLDELEVVAVALGLTRSLATVGVTGVTRYVHDVRYAVELVARHEPAEAQQ